MGTLTFQATAGGSVNLLGPNISGTVNLTLPSADGTSGQPLQTNGSGTLSFANLAIANGGTGVTSFTANQIHYGSFSQSANLTFNGTTLTANTLNLTNALGTSYGGTGLTSFTANGVVYASSTSALTTGSALVFDGTNLGVGGAVTAIGGFTSVTVNGGGSGAFTDYKVNGTLEARLLALPSELRIQNITNGTIGFYTNSSEGMRLTSTGLGIGTSSPSTKLVVNGGTSTSQIRWEVNNAAFTQEVSTNAAVNAYVYKSNDASYHVWKLSSTEAMRIDSSGNLGLGVTPSAWSGVKAFEMTAGTSLGSNATVPLTFLNANCYYNGSSWIYKTSYFANQYIMDSTEGKHKWFNAPSGTAGNTISFTQAMTLDASGNLLVGTTTTSSITQGVVLYGNTAAAIDIGHVTGTATGANYSIFRYNGTQIGSITQSGTTAVLFNVTSDQRLKENIQDADSASALIDSLKVRQFDWKTDNTHQRYGFVAQELVTVAPEAVHQPVNEEEMMAVDYSKLVPMLVKEIQSLRKRLTALEST